MLLDMNWIRQLKNKMKPVPSGTGKPKPSPENQFKEELSLEK